MKEEQDYDNWLDDPYYKLWQEEQSRLTSIMIKSLEEYSKFHSDGFLKWKESMKDKAK